MADVKIRNLDDTLVEYYKARAASAGHSLEQEFREVLGEQYQHNRKKLVKWLRASKKEIFGDQVLPDSTPLIREDRDSR